MISRGLAIFVGAVLAAGLTLMYFSGEVTAILILDETRHAHLENFLTSMSEAMIIAGIVGVTFEIVLAKHRQYQIEDIYGNYAQMKHDGFEAIHSNRRDVFDLLLSDGIEKTEHELDILGICVSLFRKADAQRQPGISKEKLINSIKEKIKSGCKIRVLFLLRNPTATDLSEIGQDLYYVRERDEEDPTQFMEGRRLKTIANKSLTEWILILVRVAGETAHHTEPERREILRNLQIKEFMALPTMSLYILDDIAYMTPYLFGRRCSNVPTLSFRGRSSQLYVTYKHHFDAIWNNNEQTRSSIRNEFLAALAETPNETIDSFHERYERIETHAKATLRNQDPERWRSAEKAMIEIAESYR